MTAKLHYRKFDTDYMRAFQGDSFVHNDLPVVTIAEDRVVFPLSPEIDAAAPDIPVWQRWNDYGIGLLAKPDRGALKQAEAAFTQVAGLGRADGELNLARVLIREGRLDEAATALRRASAGGGNPWSVAWFGAEVDLQNGEFDAAIAALTGIVETRFADARARGFDFSRDYRLLNKLGGALFERAKLAKSPADEINWLEAAAQRYQAALKQDAENFTAHYGLAQVHSRLGNEKIARHHRQQHSRYRRDDNAHDRAVTAAQAARHGCQPCRRKRLSSTTCSGLVRTARNHERDILAGWRSADPTRTMALRGRRRRYCPRLLSSASCSRATAASKHPLSWTPPARCCGPPQPSVRRRSHSPTSPRRPGVDFEHTNGAYGERLLPETMGGGVAFPGLRQRWRSGPSTGQLGHLALAGFANRTAHLPAVPKPWRRARSTMLSAAVGLDVRLYGMGTAVGDYDGDGFADVFITAVGHNRLMRNVAGERFEDVTASTGVAGGQDAWSTSAAFFDADGDDDLDLFVGNYVAWSPEIDRAVDFRLTGIGRAYGPPTDFPGAHPILYRNDGGVFTEISEDAGIHVANPSTGAPVGKALAVQPVDLNDDGQLDLVVANDTVRNFVFQNLGDGRFQEVGISLGIAFDTTGSATGAMGIDTLRFADDTMVGIAIGNFANEMSSFYVARPARACSATMPSCPASVRRAGAR